MPKLIVVDLTNSLFAAEFLESKLVKKKRKEKYIHNTLDQQVLIFKEPPPLCPVTEHTFFLNIRGTFPKTYHILGHTPNSQI